MIKNNTNIQELLYEKVKIPKSVFSGENTYSTLFLLSAFDIYVQSWWFDNFVNGYIDDAGIKHSFKRPLFVLLKYKEKTNSYQEISNYLLTRKTFVYDYIAGTEKDHILKMFVFECPHNRKSDYDCFLDGRYSQFSSEYKARFPAKIQIMGGGFIDSPIYGAIYKTATLKKNVEQFIGQPLERGQEYFGIPRPQMEIFRYQ